MKRKTSPSNPPAVAIASCSFAVEAGKDLRLIPAGEFRARDGRPKDVPAWRMNASIAKKVIASLSNRSSQIVIDYEHQTLNKEKNGQPAPAAGWIAGASLEWREGDGLYAVGVDWTARAAAYIEAKEYRYLSPVFAYDKQGDVVTILHVGLTNDPALDNLGEIAVAAATLLLHEPISQEALSMDLDELLVNIRWMLNLPTLATPEEVATELQKAVDKIKAGNTETAAAGFNILTLLDTRNASIAALTAAEPDPAKYVPIDTFQDVQNKFVALSQEVNEKQVNDLVKTALAETKLLPAQEAWARSLGAKDVAALTQYLSTTQPIAALTRTQTEGNEGATSVEDLTEDQLAICTSMGVDPKDYLKTLQAQD